MNGPAHWLKILPVQPHMSTSDCPSTGYTSLRIHPSQTWDLELDSAQLVLSMRVSIYVLRHFLQTVIQTACPPLRGPILQGLLLFGQHHCGLMWLYKHIVACLKRQINRRNKPLNHRFTHRRDWRRPTGWRRPPGRLPLNHSSPRDPPSPRSPYPWLLRGATTWKKREHSVWVWALPNNPRHYALKTTEHPILSLSKLWEIMIMIIIVIINIVYFIFLTPSYHLVSRYSYHYIHPYHLPKCLTLPSCLPISFTTMPTVIITSIVPFITSVLIINSTLSFKVQFILIIRPTRILHQHVGAYPHR